MTKVYYDIDAATLLLEERERDLELAARIGQSLLERNNELNVRNDALEQRLSALNEIVAQLHHKLELKNDLLAFYTQALDSAENEGQQIYDDSGASSLSSNSNCHRYHSSPKSPPPLLRTDSDSYRERSASCNVSVQCDNTQTPIDANLVQTCLKQLAYLSDEVERLTTEVTTKTAEVIHQQSEIESLTEQIFNLQSKLIQSDDENARMGERLEEATDAQTMLANEVGGLKSRYDECLDLLREAQQEIRALKKRQRSCRPVVHYFTTPSSEKKPSLDVALDSNFSTPSKTRSATLPSSLLVAAGGFDTPSQTCTCRSNSSHPEKPLRRISSDCDSDAGYAADSDSMLESLVCSPNPGGLSNTLSIRTLSPCLSSSPSQCGSETTPKFQKPSPGLSNRVQIVKPIEGSVTMHRWQALAHPTLSSSALDSLPGILQKEHDPVSDIPLHRRGRNVAGSSDNSSEPRQLESSLSIITSGDFASGCESTALNFEDYDDDARECSSRTRQTVFLLDDEEELYGDFEIVETRLPAASNTSSEEAAVTRTLLCRSPALLCCSDAVPIATSNDGNFIRLAGIHRNKGHQGLNLSPPQSASKPFMTRSATLPERASSPIKQDQEQQDASNPSPKSGCAHMAFYHPASNDGSSLMTASNFSSSFLPKYRQFLLKHNLTHMLQSNSTTSTAEVADRRIDEDLDETREEKLTEADVN